MKRGATRFCLGCALALLTTTAPWTALAGVTLVKDRTVQVGVEARATRLQDVNADGYPELLTLSEAQGVLNLLLNDSAAADGETFGFGQRYVHPVGEQPTELGIGDIDGDGQADIVAASREDNVIVVFLVRDGVLVESARLGAGDGPYDIFVHDLDADGDNDLLVGERVADGVSIYLSDGDGYGFAPRQWFRTVNETRQVALGDFDADGDADLAVAGEKLQIWLNDGAADFQRVQTLDLGELLQCVVAVDLDEDGADDLVVTGLEQFSLYVLSAGPGGRFVTDTDDERFQVFGTPFLPNVLMGTDIDDDGHADVVLASRSDASVLVYTGTGYGGLVATQLITETSAISSVAVGDIDRDGRKDLVATPKDHNDAILYRGMGQVPYDAEETVGLGGALGALALDDVTPDAVRVLVADNSRKLIHVLRITADDAALVGEIPTTAIPSVVRLRSLGDDREVFFSATSGTVIEHVRLDARHATAVLPSITVDDGYGIWLPGCFSSAGARELLIIEADGDAVLKSVDDAGETDVGSLALGRLPVFAEAADLDGDGIDEAVLVDGDVSVLSAQAGVLSVEERLELSAAPERMRLLDADNDGDPDLVLTYADARRIDVHFNDGGEFAAAPLSAKTTFRPVDAIAPDIDGDGNNDLAVVAAGDYGIVLYERDVDAGYPGEYLIVNRMATGQQAVDVAALPLSGPAMTPLLASFGTAGHLSLFRRTDNRGPVAEDLAFTVEAGEVLQGNLSASDQDGDDIRFTLTLPPETGEFELLDPVSGRFRYTPVENGADEVYVQYVAADDKEASQQAVVRIEVESKGGGGGGGPLLLLALFVAGLPARRNAEAR